MLIRTLLLVLIQTTSCFGLSVVYTSDNHGMFYSFLNVLSGIVSYETGKIKGFMVDTGTTPPYYDYRYGPNWWTYYCEPVQLGDLNPRETVFWKYVRGSGCYLPGYIENKMTRSEVNRVINDYIHFKPFIWDEVNQYVETHLSGYYVIGIHYRGTDKFVESPRVPYEDVVKEVLEQISSIGNTPVKIFVATDEQPFLEYMNRVFPGYVCSLEDIYRSYSTFPIHYYNNDPYESGHAAVLDALLLSKADLLIRTSSYLSLWSTFMNPGIPVIELSKRYEQN